MKNNKLKIGSRTFLFIAIIIAIISIINISYISFILPQKTFYMKETFYQDYIKNSSNKGVDYVFFGDSHAFHDINPDFIANSYNYASGAENYIKTFYKLRKIAYMDKVKAKTVVLEIDLHTFSTRLTDKTNLFNELELYSKFTSLSEIREVRKTGLLKLFIEAKFPFIENGKEFGILIYKPKELSEVYPNGWLKNKGNFSLANKTDVAIKNYEDTFKGQERISNVSFEYFQRTLELAKENGINVVLIKYPYTKEYEQALLMHNVTKEDYYDSVFRAVNSTDVNYSVLDYSNLFSDKDYLFGDPAHLNYIGAEILSKKVNEDLKRLNLSDNFKISFKDDKIPYIVSDYVYWGILFILSESSFLIYLILRGKEVNSEIL